jgi:ribonucleoside-diphosphate reductase alpha chain
MASTDSTTSYDWLNDTARTFLQRGYLLEGVTAEERVENIAQRAEELLGMPGFAQEFEHYMSQGFYSLASPIWSNFGLDRGLPISCFGSYIGDSMDSILYTHAEVGMMTKVGGGTSGYFGDIRPRGAQITNNGKSNGTAPFASLFDKIINVVSQGETRRGYFAGYIDVEHPDIEEWLKMRTEGAEIQDMLYGVVIGDDFMEGLLNGDRGKRDLWAKIIQTRINTGAPYIIYRGNMNRGRPQVYKDKGMRIHASNLCTEIALYSSLDESFVCCLSSMNLARYDAWKDTGAVRVLTYFLDAVMEEFIQGASGIPFMDRAVRFARRHRAIGIGALGWHSYLLDHRIPFGSAEAMQKNAEIFKCIRSQSYAASEDLAKELGEPEVMEGYGRRHATTMAVAPTQSSSIILGQVSPSVEPFKSNYFVRDSAKVKYTHRCQALEEVLEGHSKNTEAVWDDIATHNGSVQHLDFLTDHERDVFRTYAEIPQIAIVRQAAQRQQYIDQAQSINLAIDPSTTPAKDISRLHIDAWESGVKSLYYQKSVNAAQEFARELLTCEACAA